MGVAKGKAMHKRQRSRQRQKKMLTGTGKKNLQKTELEVISELIKLSNL